MRILIVLNAAVDDKRPAILRKIITDVLPSAQVDYLPIAFNTTVEPVGLLDEVCSASTYNLILHHCGVSNPEYRYFVNAYLQRTPKSAIVLFTGGGTENALKTFGNRPEICVVDYVVLESYLAPFITAFAENGFPSWEILSFGGGVTEAALQILTSAWGVQLAWEAAVSLPLPATDEEPGNLEQKVRAYLTGSATPEIIENDPLVKTLSNSTPTAMHALKELLSLSADKEGWNEKLKEYSRSWLGKD